MALLDLFRPKWKHSNWEVRCAAVGAISDEHILAEIATTDSHELVRGVASVSVARRRHAALVDEPLRDGLELLTPAANEFCDARLEAGAYSKPDSWPAESTISSWDGFYDVTYTYPDGMDESTWLKARAAVSHTVQSFECLWVKHNKPAFLQYVSCTEPLPRLRDLGPEPARPSLMSFACETPAGILVIILVAGCADGWTTATAAAVGLPVLSALVLVSWIFGLALRDYKMELRRRDLVEHQNYIVRARVADEIALALSGWEPPNSGLQQTPCTLGGRSTHHFVTSHPRRPEVTLA
jgi:hypothetical protein